MCPVLLWPPPSSVCLHCQWQIWSPVLPWKTTMDHRTQSYHKNQIRLTTLKALTHLLVVMFPQVPVPALTRHVKDCERKTAKTRRKCTRYMCILVSNVCTLICSWHWLYILVKDLYLDVLNFSMLKPIVGTMSCAWAWKTTVNISYVHVE